MTVPAVAAPQVSPNSASGFTYSVVSTVPVGFEPVGIAYLDNAADDSIYVTNIVSDTVSVINAATNTVDDTIGTARGLPVNGEPWGVAVGNDDTVYVTLYGPDRLAAINPRTNTVDDSQPVDSITNSGPLAIAVLGYADTDDTIFVADTKPFVDVFDGNPFDSEPRIDLLGASAGGPRQMAISADDTVYVTSSADGWVDVINGPAQTRDDTIAVGGAPSGIAVEGDTLYVADSLGNTVSVINARTETLVSTLPVGAKPWGMAYDPNFHRLYVANNMSGTVSVINTLTNTVDDTITGLTSPWAVAVSPDGSRVYVTNSPLLSQGSVSVIAVAGPTPAPTPVYPPSAPTAVVAEAGDAQATVSWSAPADAGSFPITNYAVTSSPDDKVCLVTAPARTCEVTGLANGKTYTFTVRALNGAGWGASSVASNEVTPRPAAARSIQITGSRDASDLRVVRVSGVTTQLVGAQVRPWIRFPGQSAFAPGTGLRTVGGDGTFAWSRKSGKKVYVYFTHEKVKSNTIAISAR